MGLQACSILYKTRLPLLLVFNKCDLVEHDFAIEWIKNLERFHETIVKEETYAATLCHSMSIMINKFCKGLPKTGFNLELLFKSINMARNDDFDYYLPALESRIM